MNHPDASLKKKDDPSPMEVHPYEFAANRTLGLFSRLAKRIIIILVAITIMGMMLLLLLTL